MADVAREWSRYYHRRPLLDLEVLHARFIEHRFARHSHDYHVIGYVESGVQAYSYQRARHVTPAGHVFLVNPGESHTGEPAAPDGYVYRTVYPKPALMQQLAADVTTRATLPFFTSAVVYDIVLTRHLRRFHVAIARGASSLSVESHLAAALAHLIRRYAGGQLRTERQQVSERAAVRTAREYIVAHYDADISLAKLSALVRLSPFYFARAFETDVGLPPHAYLEAVRVAKARALMLSGISIADVAVGVGYNDQSHFTHRFKRFMGLTPGQFLRSVHG
jgi:AraC-like DNA-binding protein